MCKWSAWRDSSSSALRSAHLVPSTPPIAVEAWGPAALNPVSLSPSPGPHPLFLPLLSLPSLSFLLAHPPSSETCLVAPGPKHRPPCSAPSSSAPSEHGVAVASLPHLAYSLVCSSLFSIPAIPLRMFFLRTPGALCCHIWWTRGHLAPPSAPSVVTTSSHTFLCWLLCPLPGSLSSSLATPSLSLQPLFFFRTLCASAAFSPVCSPFLLFLVCKCREPWGSCSSRC